MHLIVGHHMSAAPDARLANPTELTALCPTPLKTLPQSAVAS